MTEAQWIVGTSVAMAAAEAQYRAAAENGIQLDASLQEHLGQAAEMWSSFRAAAQTSFSPAVADAWAAIGSENDRQAFFIIWNFSKIADEGDFPVASNDLGDRLAVTWRTGMTILDRMIERGVIIRTMKGRPGGGGPAGRYRWMLGPPVPGAHGLEPGAAPQ